MFSCCKSWGLGLSVGKFRAWVWVLFSQPFEPFWCKRPIGELYADTGTNLIQPCPVLCLQVPYKQGLAPTLIGKVRMIAKWTLHG